MLHKFRHFRLLWLLPVIYLITAGGAAHGLMLCVGDEHLDVKPAHRVETTCEEICDLSADYPHASYLKGDHPSQCLDFVLIGAHGEPVPVRGDRASTQVPKPHIVYLLFAEYLHDMPSKISMAELAPEFRPQPDLPLLSLKTIVLLI